MNIHKRPEYGLLFGLALIMVPPPTVLAGGFPTTGNNGTDPYLIMRGDGNACGQGDSVTCTGAQGLTSNKYYSFFVEVPPGTGELRVELFDADVFLGGAAEATAGRDTAAGEYSYTLLNPAGTSQTVRFDRGRSTGTGIYRAAAPAIANVGCQSGTSGSSDNAWCLLFEQNNPANGHWEVRMTPVNPSSQISAVGIRASDTVTNRDLNVYARSFLHYGNQNVQARRDYTVANGNNVFYPYITAGCSLRSYDFDSDNDNGQFHTFDYLGPATPLSVTHTEASPGFSSNDDWNSTLILHASDTAATRYGIWRNQVRSSLSGSNHVEIWLSPEYINVDPALTQPTPGSFRYYFPRNDGSAPRKPIFRHSIVTVVSGATTPTEGSPTRLRVGLAIRNTTDLAITFNASNLVSLSVPASGGGATRAYEGNFTTNCGALVTQPVIGATGPLTWNPGTMAAGASCDATYELTVTPTIGNAATRHLLTAATASGTTANMLDETGAPFTLGPLCEMAIEEGTDYSSVPVSIGHVRSNALGADRLVLEFETVSETGSLEFHIIDADTPGRRLASALGAKAKGDHEPTRYQTQIDAPSAGRFYIDQLESGGKWQRFGPYLAATEHGESLQRQSVDWSAIAAEQASLAASRAPRGSVTQARIETVRSGLHRVDHAALVAVGVDLRGVPIAELALLSDGPVAIHTSAGTVFDEQSWIEFFAVTETQPYYGTRRSYWLRADAANARRLPITVQPAAIDGALDMQQHIVRLDDNREYAAGQPGDPWYLRRLSRSNSSLLSISETLTLGPVDQTQPGQLRLEIGGGLDYPETEADHAYAVSVNGVPVGEASFDGVNPHLASYEIPPGVLLAGDNSVAISMLPTPFVADRMNVEAIEIGHVGSSGATDAQWRLELPAGEGEAGAVSDVLMGDAFEAQAMLRCVADDCARQRVSGFAATPRVFRQFDGGIEEVRGLRADGDAWIIATPAAGSYHAQGSAFLPEVFPAAAEVPSLAPVDFLIVAHPSFADALQPLLAQRNGEGLSTRIVSTDALYQAGASARPQPAAIRSHLQALAAAGAAPGYVLLVGGDSYDYDDVLGIGSISFLPTHYRRTGPFINHAPSDLPYADLDDDGLPDLALGRWPVRTLSDVEQLLSKTLSHAQGTGGEGALLVSDRSASDYSFATQSQLMAADSSYGGAQASLSLADFPSGPAGSAAAREQLRQAVVDGRRWLNYFGHASPYQWTTSSLLTGNQVEGGLFDGAALPFLATQWGCWGAYHVLPQYDSLAHHLLRDDSGAAALIGASALAETGPSFALATRMLPRLDSGSRLGDAWLEGLREHIHARPETLDVNLGTTLLGDPTLPLR
jgi:hypothetical protein